MRVVVDAWNLARDRRGMGRYARRVLATFSIEPDLETTLVARNREDAAALREEFPAFTTLVGVSRRSRFDAAWYPWNGIRFRVPAPALVTMHDAFAVTLPASGVVARWREQRPIRRAAHQAAGFSTVSNWSADELSRAFSLPRERFTVVPPVPDPFWQPVAGGAEHPFVLCVGGTEPRKNVRTLLAAYDTAFAQRNVGLVIAGSVSPSDAQMARDLGAALLHPTDDRLRELYATASVVAVPSMYEGYGLTAVEAMACGAPVIASNSAALPEACDGAASLVSPHDVDGWARELRRVVFDDAVRSALHRAGLERTARIDRDAPGRAIVSLLRRCAATPR